MDEIKYAVNDYLASTDADVPMEAIEFFLENAIDTVKAKRSYPSTYTNEMITKDLEQYRGMIRRNVLKNCLKIGAEYQTGHTENNTSRQWEADASDFYGIIPISRLI